MSKILLRQMFWNFKENLSSKKGDPGERQLFAQRDVWLLGEKYEDISVKETYLSFVDKFQSILWFTYRKDFPSLRKSFLGIKYMITSDSGWGCMMRSGQMMVGNAFLIHFLGREWRHPKTSVYEPEEERIVIINNEHFPEDFNKIVDMFYDEPERSLSIHSIVEEGTKFNKEVAEWFGPSTMSNVFYQLLNRQGIIDCYLALDTVIYIDQLKAMYKRKKRKKFKPILILIPLRLGVETINPIYLEYLQRVFEIPETLGIIGGRPNHSLYFVGYQSEFFIYLDPHTVQKKSSDPRTYLPHSVKKIKFDHIDPSLALGFFCKDKKELKEFVNLSKETLCNGTFPIFSIEDKTPQYVRKMNERHNSFMFSADDENEDEDDEEEEKEEKEGEGENNTEEERNKTREGEISIEENRKRKDSLQNEEQTIEIKTI